MFIGWAENCAISALSAWCGEKSTLHKSTASTVKSQGCQMPLCACPEVAENERQEPPQIETKCICGFEGKLLEDRICLPRPRLRQFRLLKVERRQSCPGESRPACRKERFCFVFFFLSIHRRPQERAGRRPWSRSKHSEVRDNGRRWEEWE